MQATSHTNRLALETSPYLLQHAHNPVDWYPWGEEALALARGEDKPILLSIGYSACHWCHVMAHESFEDEATAASMNALFVNIKVDREERPDLDKIYQLAHQVLARRPGGWPLTVFLNPHNQAPFFAGTYFPPESRYGLPAFREALRQVADYYHQRKDNLAENNRSVLEILRSVEGEAASSMPDAGLLRQGHAALAADYDRHFGGFGGAPKFPMAGSLEFLLRYGHGGEREATDMALHALRCMAVGGLRDQLGGGFYRYSVDERWEIPHFEKMLYDNGLLLALYSQAFAFSGEPLLREAALDTAGWLMAEMQAPLGGYYAALDADSEGEEGRYYLWRAKEVQALLTEDEWAMAKRCFGLEWTPNFEGRWHLYLAATPAQAAESLGLDVSLAESLLQSARAKLLQARAGRVRPGCDDKILTAWNAMAIRGMALAGRWLGRPEFTESAVRACEFLRHNVWRDGRLYACCKDGDTRIQDRGGFQEALDLPLRGGFQEALDLPLRGGFQEALDLPLRGGFPAYLDDYAYLLDALLELLQARWNSDWLEWAVALADDLLERFADAERGGFYFTAADHEALIHRPKSFGDDAVPAGNGIAALALARLGHLLGESRYLTAAERVLRAAGQAMGRHPQAHGALLTALGEWLEPPQTVILRGGVESMAAWLEQADLPWHPRRMVFAIPATDASLPPSLALRQAGEETLAYVCLGNACLPPAVSPPALRELLASGA